MLFTTPLNHGILIKRYKRFLADIKLPNDEIVTIHCANTGAMTGCANPSDTVWYSTSGNPKRKLPYSWELTQTQDNHWICVNTVKANAIVKEAIIAEQIPELQGYDAILSEVKYGEENSRIDLLLENKLKDTLEDSQKQSCYIEVKSVTLYDVSNHFGYFPDAKTTRGQKHLRELMYMKQQGKRAVIFFLVMHTGIRSFSPAIHIDPIYSQLLKQAMQSGVEVLCYNTNISTNGITIKNKVPVVID